MGEVVCKNCGAEAFSKCPVCRTVFPDDQLEAMLSHVLKFPTLKDGYAEGTIRLKSNSVQEYFTRLIEICDILKKVGVEKYSCDHQWVFKAGHKSSIGCGH